MPDIMFAYTQHDVLTRLESITEEMQFACKKLTEKHYFQKIIIKKIIS